MEFIMERRYVVTKVDIAESGNPLVEDFCILYGTREEAEALKSRLEAGCDPSFYAPVDGLPFLEINTYDL
jgi:hypothetical protein